MNIDSSSTASSFANNSDVDGSICRACAANQLISVLDLGLSPIADALVSSPLPDTPDPCFPLQLVFCQQCSLVQILETLPPEILFCRDYPYYSSVSEYWLQHSSMHARALIKARQLSSTSLVVEVASNDGYLLRNFVEQEIPVLGIDPAEGPAKVAQNSNISTLVEFFSEQLAEKLSRDGVHADVIIANNVLAHVANTLDFVKGLRTLIKSEGLISIEVPYVRDLVDKGEFDTIYHQHLCYFSLSSVVILFEAAGLFINQVFQLPSHGGSLRIYAGLNKQVDASVVELLAQEQAIGLGQFKFYQNFNQRVVSMRDNLIALLNTLKNQGYSIVAYGAAAKGCTLLNYCGIGTETLDYIVDLNPHKQGLFMSGVRIPISHPERLLADQPDYVLLLPWNLKDEILAQQAQYRTRGGKFILSLPELCVL